MSKKSALDFMNLPSPDDSLSFFEHIKKESERYWIETSPNLDVYGHQIQQGSKWKPGLTDLQISAFENDLGFVFPQPLKDFYKTMNGLNKPGVNVYGSDGHPLSYTPVFYSFPDDLSIIKNKIDWIYEATSVTEVYLQQNDISRIFPVCWHRFMLVNVPDNPILSMWGDDIIYWADNISKLLANEIFDNIYNVWEFESNPNDISPIKFWLDFD